MTTETTVRTLAAALYPRREVWIGVAPKWRHIPETHYVLCGPNRLSHRTLGRGATEAEAWASAETTLRREVADAIALARRERDRADEEIARLTAALEVTP
jgi:hypothetical protein